MRGQELVEVELASRDAPAGPPRRAHDAEPTSRRIDGSCSQWPHWRARRCVARRPTNSLHEREERAMKAAAGPRRALGRADRNGRRPGARRPDALRHRPDHGAGRLGRRLHHFQRVQFRAKARLDPGHACPTARATPRKLVATDHSRMLVLLKIDAEAQLPVPEAVPRGEMRVGQWAIAVGRTFEAQPAEHVGGHRQRAGSHLGQGRSRPTPRFRPTTTAGRWSISPAACWACSCPCRPKAARKSPASSGTTRASASPFRWKSVLRFVAEAIEGGSRSARRLAGRQHEGGRHLRTSPPCSPPFAASGPAYKAGFRAGDTIVEAGGHAVDAAGAAQA